MKTMSRKGQRMTSGKLPTTKKSKVGKKRRKKKSNLEFLGFGSGDIAAIRYIGSKIILALDSHDALVHALEIYRDMHTDYALPKNTWCCCLACETAKAALKLTERGT